MESENRRQQYVNFMPLDLRGLVTDLDAMGFFNAPASVKYHGNYTGGLFDHSFAVTNALVGLTERLGLKWSRPESPYIVGMFHDLCKTTSYQFEDGGWNYQRGYADMPDHGAYSVILAQKMLSLTDEEIACIRWHMGAFEKDPSLWNYYGSAIERFPNVLYTHTADMIASRIIGI